MSARTYIIKVAMLQPHLNTLWRMVQLQSPSNAVPLPGMFTQHHAISISIQSGAHLLSMDPEPIAAVQEHARKIACRLHWSYTCLKLFAWYLPIYINPLSGTLSWVCKQNIFLTFANIMEQDSPQRWGEPQTKDLLRICCHTDPQ